MMIKVSENIILYWKKGQLICDNFVAHKQCALSQLAEPLLRWFSDWKDIDSLFELDSDEHSSSKLKALTQQLLDAEILISEGSDAYLLEERLSSWDAWRRSARYFHSSARTLATTKFVSLEEDGRLLTEKSEQYGVLPIYKEYCDATLVPLIVPNRSGSEERGVERDSLIDVLLRRRTSRAFDVSKSITFEQLSIILYYVCGATHIGHSVGMGKILLKTSPSGGARHPIEVYPCILNVEDVAPGIYHYSVKTHELELIAQHDFRDQIAAMCGGQDWTNTADVIFFYTAVVERSMWKYPTPRAYRVVMMDLGHLSQTFFLVAAWLGLGAFFVGALREELIENALGLDWTKEIVLGASGVGVSTSEVRAQGPLEPMNYRRE